ncbi:MAG: hypothetical protein WBG42_14685 [Cryomorphaceae bacterium]
MNLLQARALLNEHLHPYFHHKKYMEIAPLVYERKTGFGSSVFIATVTGDEEIAYVKFFTGIRHDLVELTLTNTFGLNDYFKNASYSLLLNSGFIDSQYAPPSLPSKKLSDMTTVGDMAIDFMDRKGFDFLNYYKQLSNLDHLFNDNPEKLAKWTSHNYLHRFRAMAIAKLVDRNDFYRLLQMHRGYLENRGLSGPIIAKFDSTFTQLKNLSLN